MGAGPASRPLPSLWESLALVWSVVGPGEDALFDVGDRVAPLLQPGQGEHGLLVGGPPGVRVGLVSHMAMATVSPICRARFGVAVASASVTAWRCSAAGSTVEILAGREPGDAERVGGGAFVAPAFGDDSGQVGPLAQAGAVLRWAKVVVSRVAADGGGGLPGLVRLDHVPPLGFGGFAFVVGHLGRALLLRVVPGPVGCPAVEVVVGGGIGAHVARDQHLNRRPPRRLTILVILVCVAVVVGLVGDRVVGVGDLVGAPPAVVT